VRLTASKVRYRRYAGGWAAEYRLGASEVGGAFALPLSEHLHAFNSGWEAIRDL